MTNETETKAYQEIYANMVNFLNVYVKDNEAEANLKFNSPELN